MVDKMQIARARAVLPKAVRQYIYDPNVTLIGVGWPETDGRRNTSQVTLRFHVRQKFETGLQLQSAISSQVTNTVIPREIDGIRTDVVESSSRLHQAWAGWWTAAANPRARAMQPIQCGAGIGCERIYGSGTLGGLVVDRRTGALMCLSNWHVMVGRWGYAPPLRIYQPGRLDGGMAANTFAVYERDAMMDNLDAAVARLFGDRQVISDQLGLGPVRGLRRPQLGMEVTKSGYSSQVTEGIITKPYAVVPMWYDGQVRQIRSVFYIEQLAPFTQVSDPGDSGAMWLEADTHYAVGLHFAGSSQPEHGVAMDIQDVLDSLQVDLIAG